MEICKLMNDSTLQLAIKYASKLRRMQLATKISEMACKRQEDEETRELEEQSRQMVADASQVGRPSSRASVDLFASQKEEDYEDEVRLKKARKLFHLNIKPPIFLSLQMTDEK